MVPEKLQKKSKIIYNAVKEDFYQIERTPVRGEIVTCGRLVEQKNHALLIDAFSEVVKKYPFVTLKIYGEGALREKLQHQINDLGLEKKAFLMGATSDVEKVLQTADLFVLSSDYEGMPNALMEAMAAGVPCISTDCPCGGPRELLGDDSNLLIPVGNKLGLEDKILDFFENQTVLEECGKELKKIAKIFTPEVIEKKWIEYVNEIVIG